MAGSGGGVLFTSTGALVAFTAGGGAKVCTCVNSLLRPGATGSARGADIGACVGGAGTDAAGANIRFSCTDDAARDVKTGDALLATAVDATGAD